MGACENREGGRTKHMSMWVCVTNGRWGEGANMPLPKGCFFLPAGFHSRFHLSTFRLAQERLNSRRSPFEGNEPLGLSLHRGKSRSGALFRLKPSQNHVLQVRASAMNASLSWTRPGPMRFGEDVGLASQHEGDPEDVGVSVLVSLQTLTKRTCFLFCFSFWLPFEPTQQGGVPFWFSFKPTNKVCFFPF